jgi:hypothetical protein
MQRARVIAAHRAPDRAAIRVAAGDAVTLGERDTDWPQFVWTTLAQGLGGWVPAALFDRDSGAATALEDYDTRELTTDIGEVVTLHYPQENWWWAENAAGDSGWVPDRALELIKENTP